MLAKSTSLKSTNNTLSYSEVSDNRLGNVSVKTILRGSLFFLRQKPYGLKTKCLLDTKVC